MKVVWSLAMLVGCYEPSIVPGAPCDPAVNNCPRGQTCQLERFEYVCLPQGTADAAVDDDADAGLTDPDGDGILSNADNCPTIANRDQHDEENDDIGDVCDPCPVSQNNTDSDGDGVGDGCDPRPDRAGDTFVVFEPFAQALPVGWTTTNSWSVSNDELRVVSSSGAVSSVRTNLPATSRMMAVTSLIADQVAGPNASIGIVLPYASALGGGGILCSLFQSDLVRSLSIQELGPDTMIDNDAFAWKEDINYVLVAVRDATSYQCASYTDMMTMQAAMGTSQAAFMSPTIGLRSGGTTARFQWLMIVKIP